MSDADEAFKSLLRVLPPESGFCSYLHIDPRWWERWINVASEASRSEAYTVIEAMLRLGAPPWSCQEYMVQEHRALVLDTWA